MDDATKTMMLTLASGIAKKALITLGAGLVTHGIELGTPIDGKTTAAIEDYFRGFKS